MADVTYQIVEHDGGWAYKLEGAYSETFRTRDEAKQAAARAASEQQIPGETEAISYQDAKGEWHDELASGSDRPTPGVEDV